VKVMPQVTGKAVKGGCSIGSAQFDFGGARPSVPLPSLIEGVELAGPDRGVVLADGALQPLRVDAEPLGQLADRAGVDARGARRLVVDRAQHPGRPGVEDLGGDALRLAQHLGAVLGVGVVAEVGALVDEALAVGVDHDPDRIRLARVAVGELEVARGWGAGVPNSDLVWTLIASLYIGNVMLLLLNLPLIRVWVTVLEVSRPLLYSGILVFATLGVYSLSGSVVEVLVMYGIGVLGFFMRRYDFPIAPVILGVILGPLMEVQARRALVGSGEDLGVFVGRPLTVILLVLAIAAFILPNLPALSGWRRERADAAAED
jgi:Tripartite tricarboxylate transporter TctA family